MTTHCSFCLRLRSEVRFLVAGDNAAICDRCLEIANEAASKRKATNNAEPVAVEGHTGKVTT